MYWIDNNTGIPTPPSTPAVVSLSKRYFTNGGAGVQPSTPEDFWFHMVQEELLGILTLAGVTPDKSDLNQVAKAIQSIAFSAYPVGAPIPWPTDVPPSGFLAMTGQSFSATTYPKLALAYPALVLPDMRAFSIRGFDAGRGIDAGRVILSEQGDAGRELTGSFNGVDIANPVGATGCFSSTVQVSTPAAESFTAAAKHNRIDFKASNQIPVANEFRIKTIAFFYVVRAV